MTILARKKIKNKKLTIRVAIAIVLVIKKRKNTVKKRIEGMNKNKDNIGKINKAAFWPAVIALLLFIGIGIVKTEVVGSFMTRALYIIADYFGAYINILSLIFLILAGIIIISRYGDIVIGGKDAKPDYSMLSWCAMSIYSGQLVNQFIIICKHLLRLRRHRHERRESLQ